MNVITLKNEVDKNLQSNIRQREPWLEVPPGPSQEPSRREREGTGGARGIKDTKRAWTLESTKQGSSGLTETETTVTEPARVCATSSACVLCFLAWCFGGNPDSESRVVSDSFACS